MARAYMECQPSLQGYDSLLLQYRNLQAKRSSVENVLRASFRELVTQLTAIANVLVDGGLFRSEMSKAALGEADVEEIRARVGNLGEGKDFFEPKIVASMLEYVTARMETSISVGWMQQTKAAFDMAEELLLRHRDFGIRDDGLQISVLQRAWE